MKDIIKIHGSSSRVTFELEDATIFGSGEFCARSGLRTVLSCPLPRSRS